MDLQEHLNYNFHKEFFEILYNSTLYHRDFMGESKRLLIDCRDFFNISIRLLSNKELSSYVPEKYYEKFLSLSLETKYLTLYLFSNDECFIISENEDDPKNRDVTEDKVTSYVKAYKNGLLKEAYLKSLDEDSCYVFSIIDGEAKVLSSTEALEYISNEDDLMYFQEMLEENLVVVMFKNTNDENSFWIDAININFEGQLFKEWGIDNV